MWFKQRHSLTSKKLVKDPLTGSWVGEGQPFTDYGRSERNVRTATGDAFAGGVILGICGIGVVWTILLGVALAL